MLESTNHCAQHDTYQAEHRYEQQQHHQQCQAISINHGSKTALPVELIFEEALPEGILVHDAWHIGHESPMHVRLLSKDLLHTLWCHLIPHLSQHGKGLVKHATQIMT